jgi:hypothetical protein
MQVMKNPTPQALIELQGALLALDPGEAARDQALETSEQCYAFLTDLQSKLTAKQYSELASMLDIGAVGLVALESLVANGEKNLWVSLLMGGLAEGLMVAASRQYIKGWKAEAGVVFAQAAWHLNEALWQMSTRLQPGLSPIKRWQSIQSLLAPAHDPDVDNTHKAVLLGLVHQTLLLIHLIPLLSEQQ